MKYLKQISSVLFSIVFFVANPTSGSAQDWPDPLVGLVSVSSDTSSYFVDGKIRFSVSINRINGSTYSDITRVWICPKGNWDGFMCNAGQFLVSTTPNSGVNQFVIESPALTLADGEYVITGVSFRNGAQIAGFTLMYPRVGVVTIGGIATTIALVNIAAADFSIITPVPEPEPEVEPEPENTEPETAPEPPNESGTTQSENSETVVAENSETSTEPTASDSTNQSTTNVEPESGTTSSPTDQVVESESSTNDLNEPVEGSSSNNENESDSAEDTLTEPVATEPTASPTITESVNSQSDVSQSETTEPVATVQPAVTQPIVTPTVIAQGTTEIQTLTPNVETVITSDVEIKPEPIVTIFDIAPAVLPAIKRQVVMRDAIGGKVLKIDGEAKLVRTVSAGVGRLKLIGSNDSRLMVKLGNKVIAQVYLGKDQVIAWRSNGPGKLKLILSGDSAELNIDALQLNGKLIANPSFQMRP